MCKPLALFLARTNEIGKSTFRDVLHKDKFENLLIIDPDKFTKENGGDNRQGKKDAIVVFNECIENKTPFCMETTLFGKSVSKVGMIYQRI